MVALTPEVDPSIFDRPKTTHPSRMKIDRAVVPVAGLGTRLLPTTQAIPKEMLPLGRLPVIQHVIAELAGGGISQFLFVTGRNKEAIENHLDLAFASQQAGQQSLRFLFTRQRIPVGQAKPMGTGDAIACAEEFAGDESFVAAYGDSLIRSPVSPSVVERMIDCHSRNEAACTIAVYRVADDQTRKYGIVVPATDALDGGECLLSDIVEKPDPDRIASRLAVSARYVYSPAIFEQLRRVSPSPDGEMYITDAIRGLIRDGHPVHAVLMERHERRLDIGSHQSYYEAFLEFALEDSECGAELRAVFRDRLQSRE